jgi:ABC-type polysaccharide/polyol phosphate export permease
MGAVPAGPIRGWDRHVTSGFELRSETTPLRLLVRNTWASRSLLVMLARKDFYVRYRRASFGVLCAIGLPVIQALVLAAVFSRVVKVTTPGTNYAVFVFAGVVAWTFFAATLATSATAIVDGAGLSTRIYFPRAILPLVSIGANLVGLALSLIVLVVMALFAGEPLGPRVLLIIPAAVLLVAFTCAISLVLSALHVYFRDVRYFVQVALLVWFYVTPVIYPLSLARDLRGWLELNPLTGCVELMRAAVVGADAGWGISVVWCMAWTVLLTVIALALHRRFDRVFVDLL